MTDYQALAKEIDALSETELRLSEGEVVNAKQYARREDVISVRVSAGELEEITKAAAANGRRVSDFVRDATLGAARQRATSDRWLSAPVADALDELVERIEEQKRTTRRPRRTARR